MATRTLKRASAAAPAPSSARASWIQNPWWLFACAIAAGLAVFGPALHGEFVFDDFHLPFADPKAPEMPAGFWIGGVRPMLMATYWANFLLSGTNTLSYHVLNVVLHAATALLVYLILARIFTLSGAIRETRAFAIAGAAIFLLHPLQTESVDYIAGRSEVMSGFLFCAAWLVFLNRFESEMRVVASLKILLLAGAAVLAKENAICLPAVLFATDCFLRKESLARQMRKRLKLYVPFVLGGAAGAALILRSLTSGTAAGFSSGATPFQYALTQCRAILVYVRLFFFPAGQNGDWQLPFFKSPADGGAWLYVLALLALVAFIFPVARRMPLAAFGLVIFLLMLAPTSSVVPIKDALAERRMYMPIVGMIVFTCALAARVSLKPGHLRICAIAAVLTLAALTWARSGVWAGPVAFWSDAARENPANTRAHFGLGSALTSRNRCDAAVKELAIARAQDPKNPEVVWNLAEAYGCNRQPERALPLYQEFASTHSTADAWNHIAFTEANLGRLDEVFAALAKALQIDPGNATSYAYRGLANIAVNNASGAQADFERALQLDPRQPVALDGMRRVSELRGK